MPFEKLMVKAFEGAPLPPAVVDTSLAKASLPERGKFALKAFESQRHEYLARAIVAGVDPSALMVDRVPLIKTYVERPNGEGFRTVIDAVLEHAPQDLSSLVPVANGNDLALTLLLENADYGLFGEILASGVDLNAADDSGLTPLMSLAGSNSMGEEKTERLLALLDRGADPLLKDELDATVLHWIEWYPVDADFSAFLGKVLEAGVDVNESDGMGDTPLHRAIFPFGNTTNGSALVRWLLDHGADKDIRNDAGATPLDLARWVLSWTEEADDSGAREADEETKRIMRYLEDRPSPGTGPSILTVP